MTIGTAPGSPIFGPAPCPACSHPLRLRTDSRGCGYLGCACPGNAPAPTFAPSLTPAPRPTEAEAPARPVRRREVSFPADGIAPEYLRWVDSELRQMGGVRRVRARGTGRVVVAESVETGDLYDAGIDGLCRALARYDSRRGRLEPFARRCIRFAMIDAARREDARRENIPAEVGGDGRPVSDPPDAGADDPSTLAAAGELEAAVATLPPRLRRVVELHVAGLSYAEIGEELGVSKSRAVALHEQAISRTRGVYGKGGSRVLQSDPDTHRQSEDAA